MLMIMWKSFFCFSAIWIWIIFREHPSQKSESSVVLGFGCSSQEYRDLSAVSLLWVLSFTESCPSISGFVSFAKYTVFCLYGLSEHVLWDLIWLLGSFLWANYFWTYCVILLISNFRASNCSCMFFHISNGIWVFLLNAVCTLGVVFEDFSFLICLGLGQSFAKWSSPILKHFILGFRPLQMCHAFTCFVWFMYWAPLRGCEWLANTYEISVFHGKAIYYEEFFSLLICYVECMCYCFGMFPNKWCNCLFIK